MKKIILVIFFSLVLVSCEKEAQEEVKNEVEKIEIKEEFQENINTGVILENDNIIKTEKINYSSNLTLQERLKLINENEKINEEKYLEKDGNIELSKIKIIRGDNSFDYSFKYIEKTGIELYGTGLSEDIKNITITPIIYNLDDLKLTENEIYKSDYIDKEPFTLKGYKTGNKSFKYNAFYKYKVFTSIGLSFEITFNFKNGLIDKDYIFINGIFDANGLAYFKDYNNINFLLKDNLNKYKNFDNDRILVKDLNNGNFKITLCNIRGGCNPITYVVNKNEILKTIFYNKYYFKGFKKLDDFDKEYFILNNKLININKYQGNGYLFCTFGKCVEIKYNEHIYINNFSGENTIKITNNNIELIKKLIKFPNCPGAMIDSLETTAILLYGDNYYELIGYEIFIYNGNNFLLKKGSEFIKVEHSGGCDAIGDYRAFLNGNLIID